MASFGKLLKKISNQTRSEGGGDGNSSHETVKKVFGSKLGGLQTKIAAGQILGRYLNKDKIASSTGKGEASRAHHYTLLCKILIYQSFVALHLLEGLF